MSKHTIFRILFVAGFLSLVGLHFYQSVSIWAIVALTLTYLFILFCGSYFIRLNFFVRSLWHGSSTEKAISITFDDGPMQDFTPHLLDILKSQNVPALFFLIGKNIQGNENLVHRIVEEGHIIGNHSFSHDYWFSLRSSGSILEDLKKCDEEIFRVTGKMSKLFRPPYGVTNPMISSAIEAQKYDCIGWSIRTYDTQAKSPEALLKKTLKNLKNGDVILFHDWGPQTIGILSAFITEARGLGYDIVRADKLLKVKPYS